MINNLFNHMQWADAEVWRAVLTTPSANSDPKIRELLHHMHLCQHAWLLIWTKKPLDFPEESAFANLAAVAKWGREYYDQVADFFDSVTESELRDLVEPPWTKDLEEKFGRAPEPATVSESMIQITSHTTYHRGQVQARLRQLGAEPPMVDFIAWVWLGKPEPEWPQD